MKLYSVRGGSKEELEAKEYNIGIGISLGNKWFTPENILEQIRWAFQYTREKVIVYVADSIHAINLEVRDRITYERALVKAKDKGEKILEEVKKLVDQLPDEQKKMILYARWDEIVGDSFKNKLFFLDNLYENDTPFRQAIENTVRGFLLKENRHFSEEQIHKLGKYVVAELLELLNRMEMKGTICDAYAYPHDTEVTRLVEDIQGGKIFPEIKDRIMDTKPKVFLEVR